MEVNGQDLTGAVEAFYTASEPGMAERLTIIFRPGAARIIEGDGIVEVAHGGEDLVAFLKGVDPKALSEEAFNRLEYGSGDAWEEALNVLVEMAEKERREP